VKIPPESCNSIPEEMYRSACVSTTEEAVASCQVVGYPAMIKASWGGGGKGIRKVGFLLVQHYQNDKQISTAHKEMNNGRWF
jgi:pyruvate carboxylase